MKRDYEKNKIGYGMAGYTGMPGQSYSAIWVSVALYDDGIFEARAKYGRGSNQGHLEEHHSLSTRARGGTVYQALGDITPDILEWEDSSIGPAERRAAIRECQIDAEDWIEENLTKEERVAKLRALLAEAESGD